jgi:hypothetical protein
MVSKVTTHMNFKVKFLQLLHKQVFSALTLHVHVTWNDGTKSRILDSEAMIMIVENNEITLTKVDVVLNIPLIIWPKS